MQRPTTLLLFSTVVTCNFFLYLCAESSLQFDVNFEKSMGCNGAITPGDCARKKNIKSLNECIEDMKFFKALYEKNNLCQLKAENTPIIPKIIHQIWIGPKTPPAIFKESQESIRKWLPDWEYKLWTDADLAQFELKNKKEFDASKNYGEKADILRLEILHKFGGVYLDVDVICLKSFNILNHTYEFFTTLEPMFTHVFLSNGVIGSIPGHPILKDYIENIKKNWLAYERMQFGLKIFHRTGPVRFTNSFLTIARQGKDEKIIAFPGSFFFPVYDMRLKDANFRKNDINSSTQAETFAVHLWAASWINRK